MSRRIEISEPALREFMEAAEEVRDQGRSAPVSGFETKNVLGPDTEDRFERALDALKFDLAKERS